MDKSRSKKKEVITIIGLAIMVALSLTQLFPAFRMAGLSVLIGIAFFFILEAYEKTPKNESGLRFKGILAELRKPGVLVWVLLPIITAIIPLYLGDFLFNGEYSAHVVERAGQLLSFEKIPLLVLQVVIFALGEEIAWRGFFVGRTENRFPFILCAVVSSVLFAMGHIADGNMLLVLYDIGFVFIDSMIFSVIFHKTGNCGVSTVAHIIGNAIGIAMCFILA